MKIRNSFICLLAVLLVLSQVAPLLANGRYCASATTGLSSDIRDFCANSFVNNNTANGLSGALTNERGTNRTTLEGLDVGSFKLLSFVNFVLELIVSYLQVW